MVGFARFGTGAGGRAGAKGGRGTDCREGPEDEAGKKKKREADTQRGFIISKKILIHNHSLSFNFALLIPEVYEDINAPQRQEPNFQLELLFFRETIGHKSITFVRKDLYLDYMKGVKVV